MMKLHTSHFASTQSKRHKLNKLLDLLEEYFSTDSLVCYAEKFSVTTLSKEVGAIFGNLVWYRKRVTIFGIN